MAKMDPDMMGWGQGNNDSESIPEFPAYESRTLKAACISTAVQQIIQPNNELACEAMSEITHPFLASDHSFKVAKAFGPEARALGEAAFVMTTGPGLVCGWSILPTSSLSPAQPMLERYNQRVNCKHGHVRPSERFASHSNSANSTFTATAARFASTLHDCLEV